VGRGGHGHLFPLETGLVRPGMFLFAYDMHCTTFGAVGALALGVGPEVTAVLAMGSLWTQVPATIRIELTGRLGRASHARDVGFVLAHGLASGRWGADYDYRVIEFGGPGAETLDLSARVALSNSVTELGIATVLFSVAPPGCDPNEVAGIVSDPRAAYQDRIEIDLGDIEPQVALPGGPEKAAPVTSAVGREIQHAFIGSCGSGMYQDFADAAALLRGRRIAEGVRMFIVPGSVGTARRLADEGFMQVFMEAGAIILPAGCGPCAGGLMAPLGAGEVSISTAATNHSGRFGAPGGEPYLGSPLTVAVSALRGRITDPRDYLADA
jgi:3-isopropylmalate/(R)-2-methylmalate dehydratase large subunit